MRWLIKSRPRLTGLVKHTEAGFELKQYRAVFTTDERLTPGKPWEEREIYFFARSPSVAVRWLLALGCPMEMRNFDGRRTRQ